MKSPIPLAVARQSAAPFPVPIHRLLVRRCHTAWRVLALGLLSSALGWPTFGQGTAFTYQGRLNDGANPASGSYDLTFELFSVSSGAGQVGGTLTSTATPADGLALAAIQGLNHEVEEKEPRIRARERELAVLKELVAIIPTTKD